MQKIIKVISKIVFLLIVAFLLSKLATLVFTEQQIVENKDVKVYEVSQNDIISSGQEIVIKSFDAISDMKWINNSELLIEGTINQNSERYIFDMINYELKLYKEEHSTNIDYGEFTFIKDIPGYGALCSKGAQLGLLSDGTFEVITENATYKDELKFNVSDDSSKLVYYYNEKDNIVTYSFEKDFYRSINIDLTDDIKLRFNSVVQISPEGGYVSVEHRSDDLEDAYFSIYGADSGKLYADKVYGTYLSWSQKDEYVCYYYTNESEKLVAGTIDGMDISSKRIGYYDVLSKEIKYIDSSQSEKNMLSKIYWSDTTITTLTGTVTDTIQFDSILSYDFKTNSFNEWLLDIEPIQLGSNVELINYEKEYILLLQSGEQHHVMRIMKDSKEVIVYENLLPFKTLDRENIYFYNAEGTFITVDHEKMIVSDSGFQGYISLNDSAFIALPNAEMNHIAVWLTNKSEIKILNTK